LEGSHGQSRFSTGKGFRGGPEGGKLAKEADPTPSETVQGGKWSKAHDTKCSGHGREELIKLPQGRICTRPHAARNGAARVPGRGAKTSSGENQRGAVKIGDGNAL